ncbi:MAG: hypothetical protein HC921_21160 [Synechococcaceae cyanobacterium SM2_3_1]|nr:hypothetical protein [Synechococcaceae cyanobacterium SM2_3_1]
MVWPLILTDLMGNLYPANASFTRSILVVKYNTHEDQPLRKTVSRTAL